MKLLVTYSCRRKIAFQETPQFIAKSFKLWSAYNKQMIKGFPNSAAEEKAREAASLCDGDVLKNVVWEVNTSWLSDPNILKPMSLLKEPKKGEVTFEFDSDGSLSLDGEISVVLEINEAISGEDLNEWASDNDLQDIFMLTVKSDSDTEVLDEDNSLSLEVLK